MDAYGNVHRAMLQMFMSKQFMTEKEAMSACREVFSVYSPQAAAPTDVKSLMTFVNVMNEEIGHGGTDHAEIKRIRADGHPEPIWGLGQVLHEDEIDQEAKENALKELRWLKPAELELFKSVVEAIVMSHGRKGKIDYFRATNLGQFSKKRGRGGADEEDEPASKMFKDLTATESQSVLDRLVELKWLQYVTVEGAEARGSHNGKSITLGIRSILDLSKYIETRHDQICCHWTTGGEFKWTGGAEEGDEGSNGANDAGKERADADGNTEDEDEVEKQDGDEEPSSSSRQKRAIH